jgi:hypothetical protein
MVTEAHSNFTGSNSEHSNARSVGVHLVQFFADFIHLPPLNLDLLDQIFVRVVVFLPCFDLKFADLLVKILPLPDDLFLKPHAYFGKLVFVLLAFCGFKDGKYLPRVANSAW